MLFMDWVHFLALYLITKVTLYFLAGRYKDSAWGPTLALVA